jgi:hypothetical protein
MNTGVGYLSIPGVPTDLLTSSFYGPADYAGTYVDSTTVMSFSNTDLVITFPTPFDEWLHIAIYTETPNASIHSSSDFQIWPASVCGTYSTSTEYSSTTLTKTLTQTMTGSTSTITYPSVSSSSITAHILDQLQPSDPSNSLRYSFIRGDNSGDYMDRLNTLDVRYIQAKSTQFTEPKVEALLPTGILDWLATQEEVIKQYPYIKNCWLGPVGEGQPTVHVPVMALTATSSIFLDSSETPTVESVEKESTSSLTTKSTVRTIVTVRTSTASSDASITASVESKQSPPDAAGPESTGKPQSEVEKPDSDAADAEPKPAAQTETEDKSQTPEVAEPSATPKSTASPTTGFIEGVVSAIQSAVAQKGGVSQAEPSSGEIQKTTTPVEPAAVISTTVSEERPAESVTGFAIGTQTASPGGEPITSGGSVYSALPSGSGLRVVADGQTSTITDVVLPGVAVAQHSGSDSGYVVGDNTLTAGGPAITSDGKTISALPAGSGVRIAANGQTTTVPAAALTDSVTLRPGDSEDEYVFAGITLSAGDNALDFAGVTYSALKSGSGIIIIAEDSTSTASVGQAIGANFAIGSDLDSPSPLMLPAGSQQRVTSAAISSNTTISVQETESSSSTRGLGDAIISGMGGGNADDGEGDANTPDPQSSTEVEAASHAVRRSVHVLLSGFCTFAFALALL